MHLVQKEKKLLKELSLYQQMARYIKQKSTVTIPGYTLDKTKKEYSGSIRVAIEASASGAEYNQEATDLSVKNFSGTKKKRYMHVLLVLLLEGRLEWLPYLMTVFVHK